MHAVRISSRAITYAVALGLTLVAALGQARAGTDGAGDPEAAPVRHQAPPAAHCDRLPEPPGRALGILKQCPPEGSSSGIAKGDFNGDGFGDLAIGSPSEDVDGFQDLGKVTVVYGSAQGLVRDNGSAVSDRFFEGKEGVPGTQVAGDRFGAALASGDFNGDAFSDLAIGVPGREVTLNPPFCSLVLNNCRTFQNAGAVIILYGSEGGVTATNAAVPAPRFIAAISPTDDSEGFGSALAWGDFNGDTVGDLAVGAPGRDLVNVLTRTRIDRVGGVFVLNGVQGTGLTTTGALLFSQDQLLEDPEAFESFGAVLAAGNFDGDQFTDLAVGVPRETTPRGGVQQSQSGAVAVIYGTLSGLSTTRNQLWTQNSSGVPTDAEAGDSFGATLAVGDFNGDGRKDLAIGVPSEDLDPSNDSPGPIHPVGAVQILNGSVAGIASAGNQFFTASSLGQTPADFDRFGGGLAAANFTGDAFADLIIGTPQRKVAGKANAGQLSIIIGSANGLDPSIVRPNFSNAEFVTGGQDNLFLGATMSAWDFGGLDTAADLALGLPFADRTLPDGTVAIDGGSVSVFFGKIGGDGVGSVLGSGQEVISQETPGIAGDTQPGDFFGSALY